MMLYNIQSIHLLKGYTLTSIPGEFHLTFLNAGDVHVFLSGISTARRKATSETKTEACRKHVLALC